MKSPSNRAFIQTLASILALAYILSFSFRAEAEALNEIWRDDRYKHATVSAVLASTGYVLMRKFDFNRWESLVTSAAAAILIGTAKETYDKEVDPGDIKADFVGAIAAGGVCITIDLIAF